MGLTLWKTFFHAVALVQFMQEYEATLFFQDVVVDPDLASRDKLIDVVMAACGRVGGA